MADSSVSAVASAFSGDRAGFPRCHCAASKIPLAEWCDLFRHRPSPAVLAELANRGMSLQDIQTAYGAVNVDYYPIEITRMPLQNGVPMTPEQLQEAIRSDPNRFLDRNLTNFRPYDTSRDPTQWTSSNPVGTVFGIDMGPNRFLGVPTGGVDDGSVVASSVSSDRWIFTTIWARDDGYHPVSGNREFGFSDPGAGNGPVVFYTRGVDRLSTRADAVVGFGSSLFARAGLTDRWREGVAFDTADQNWRAYQDRVAAYVNDRGGAATVGPSRSVRYDMGSLRRLCTGK